MIASDDKTFSLLTPLHVTLMHKIVYNHGFQYIQAGENTFIGITFHRESNSERSCNRRVTLGWSTHTYMHVTDLINSTAKLVLRLEALLNQATA